MGIGVLVDMAHGKIKYYLNGILQSTFINESEITDKCVFWPVASLGLGGTVTFNKIPKFVPYQ